MIEEIDMNIIINWIYSDNKENDCIWIIPLTKNIYKN